GRGRGSGPGPGTAGVYAARPGPHCPLGRGAAAGAARRHGGAAGGPGAAALAAVGPRAWLRNRFAASRNNRKRNEPGGKPAGLWHFSVQARLVTVLPNP